MIPFMRAYPDAVILVLELVPVAGQGLHIVVDRGQQRLARNGRLTSEDQVMP